MRQLRFYCTERLQFGTGDKASDAQRDRLGHSRINACGDGAGSSVSEARGSSLLEGEYVTRVDDITLKLDSHTFIVKGSAARIAERR